MIPSNVLGYAAVAAVYQRGLVIDSQLAELGLLLAASISKGIGD